MSGMDDITGKLNKRITIEDPVAVTDDYGNQTVTWSTFLTVWAAIDPSNGGESVRERMRTATNSVTFLIRYQPGITTKMRISYGGRLFEIRSIINPDELNQTLEIVAIEGEVT